MGLTEWDRPACGDVSADGTRRELPTDCADVMRDVWLFLDDELDPDRRAAVQRHLDECSPCLEQAGMQVKLKKLLARKCGGEHAPERLRERIVTRLTAWQGTSRTTTVTRTSVSETSVTRTSMTHTSTRLQWRYGVGSGTGQNVAREDTPGAELDPGEGHNLA